MDIGQAVKALKSGCKVARLGWEHKDEALIYLSPSAMKPFMVRIKPPMSRTATTIQEMFTDTEEQPVEASHFFAIYTAQKKITPGWVASTEDLIATDWYLVD